MMIVHHVILIQIIYLTNCDDLTTIIYTSDDLSAYVGQVVELDPDCPGCWIVGEVNGPIPSDVPVVVDAAFEDCEACKTTYYQLTDCTDTENPIITSTDLSAYVGSIIILEWCPTICWHCICVSDKHWSWFIRRHIRMSLTLVKNV
jgi:hypothetical protein